MTTTTPLCACGKPSPDARLCRACTARLSRLLTRAADIAGDLDDAVARLLKRGSGGKRTDEQPLPLDLAASDIAHGLRNCLAGWVRVIKPRVPDRYGPLCPACIHLSCRAIRRAMWPADAVPSMASWLGGQLDVIRQHEAAAELLADVGAHVTAALAVVDRQPELHPAGLCSQCGLPLRAEPGADTAWCREGHFNEGIAARRAARAAMADQLGTPSELARTLAVLGYAVRESTISSWGTRGRLARRPGGLYRLSDALALAAARSARA